MLDAWIADERAPFAGWDFSYIASRSAEEQPPWSYEELARAALAEAETAVDLGTGGGELLSRLRDAYPRLMVATEAYAPNLAVADARLRPLGAHVVAYEADDTTSRLPFRDGCFDAALSRHEAYDPAEVARVLSPRGVFVTQQVDGRSLAELLAYFGTEPHWPHVTVDTLAAGLRGAGLVLEDARSWWGAMRFHDVGAVVYYLKAIPWEVPGFSVARHANALFELQGALERQGTLSFRIGRFILRARRDRRGRTR